MTADGVADAGTLADPSRRPGGDEHAGVERVGVTKRFPTPSGSPLTLQIPDRC